MISCYFHWMMLYMFHFIDVISFRVIDVTYMNLIGSIWCLIDDSWLMLYVFFFFNTFQCTLCCVHWLCVWVQLMLFYFDSVMFYGLNLCFFLHLFFFSTVLCHKRYESHWFYELMYVFWSVCQFEGLSIYSYEFIVFSSFDLMYVSWV